jgi:hypothetical protein
MMRFYTGWENHSTAETQLIGVQLFAAATHIVSSVRLNLHELAAASVPNSGMASGGDW